MDQSVLIWRLFHNHLWQAHMYYYIWSCLCHGEIPLVFLRVALELYALGFITSSTPVTIVWICPVRQKWATYMCSWPDKLRFVRFVSKNDTQLIPDPVKPKYGNQPGYQIISINLWTISLIPSCKVCSKPSWSCTLGSTMLTAPLRWVWPVLQDHKLVNPRGHLCFTCFDSFIVQFCVWSSASL